MRIAINAASANSGGAVTYLRNVLPGLSQSLASNGGGRVVLWAPRTAIAGMNADGFDYRDPMGASHAAGLSGTLRRLWFDQRELPRLLGEERIDALFSSASFGMLRSPVRQVLLVRNSLYFDSVAMNRIRSRALHARYVAQRMLIVQSVRAADVVLFPTRAMLELVAPHVQRSGDAQWLVAPYGARHDLFHPGEGGRPRSRQVTLLNVSVYYDQKNLGTLFGALERLRVREPGRHRLRITAGMRSIALGPNYPNLESEREACLRLEQAEVVEDLGAQSYATLPALYRAADIFVFPSYTESFGHPLVEAMASGLPVVAADVPVNREMCGNAAVYFSPFDTVQCADAIGRVADDEALAARLGTAGVARARHFTWGRHVEVLCEAFRGRPA